MTTQNKICPQCKDTGIRQGTMRRIDACPLCAGLSELAYQEALVIHKKQMLERDLKQ